MSVHMSGPILDGTAGAIVKRNAQQMDSAVADEALRRVHDRLGHVLKHPTGYYESHVVKTMRSDGADVTDSRVLYGPWLEGVGSRNATTRFKGYHTFQIVGQELDADVPSLTEPQVRKMMGELGGN